MTNALTESKLNEKVTVTCYRQTEVMIRRDAIEYYFQGMCCSEGSEHERYETIFFQLMMGAMTASDETDFRCY